MSCVLMINLCGEGWCWWGGGEEGDEGIPIFNIYRYIGVKVLVAVLTRVLTE